MLRSSPKNQPLYREVIKDALHSAWFGWRYWILAFLAGILATAGSYDILWGTITGVADSGNRLSANVSTAVNAVIAKSGSSFQSIVSVIGGIEMLMLITVVIVAISALSCIAQGALVYALGAKKRGQAPTLSEAFQVGTKALWPVVVLNVFVMALLWILRFLSAMPLILALENTTATTYLLYILTFIIFVPLSFLASILQVFSLNGMILQGATLAESIRRSYAIFKKNWVVVVETAALQILATIAISILVALSLVVIMIPVAVMFFASVFLPSGTLFTVAVVLGAFILIAVLLIASAFTIQLQYATWTYMYRRLGEGGAIPKLHRMIRNFTGFFSVPE